MDRKQLTEQHSRLQSVLFRAKVAAFSLRRMLHNALSGIRRHAKAELLAGETVIAVSESELWNAHDNPQNWILTAGKVENLRIAIRRIDGLEIPANHTFSFWKHIGNPNNGKGYVTGREIREGCIVPTKAGGLCQLSNALYDAALKARFTITERHKHTQVVRGSLAEQDRDATVKWNYVDLRFRSPHAFRIEAELTADRLIVRFKSVATIADAQQPAFVSRPVAHLNDCFSCGNTSCFQHPTGEEPEARAGITAFVLDAPWPEHEAYVRSVAGEKALFLDAHHSSPFGGGLRGRISQGMPFSIVKLLRSILVRLAAFRRQNVFEASLKGDRLVARALARQLPVDCTHVVVSQQLLPFLWQTGALGGRTFDVLITRLPLQTLHQRLDAAHHSFPESATLNDFRAPETLVQRENAALTSARKIVTPHREIAALFRYKTTLLDWQSPTVETPPEKGTQILFPASALGRKGAYELKRLVRELGLEIAVYGSATEATGFWEDLPVTRATNLDNAGLVLFPTYVEHQPRLLLKAIAKGIPVITTTAAGLPESELVTIIPVGDYAALKAAVAQFLSTNPPPASCPKLAAANADHL